MDQTLQTLQGSGDHGVDVTSWMSVSPRGLWKVQLKRIGEKSIQAVSNSGADGSCLPSYCPRLGSLCQVRVRLKANTDEGETLVSEERTAKVSEQPEFTEAEATAFQSCQESGLQVPLGDWTILRLGEGQCDITEACLEGMRVGEKCEMQLSPVENGSKVSDHHSPEEKLPFCLTVELKQFTPGKESWEMSPGDKLEWVKSHKERGGVRFRSGNVWGAADSYSRALKLLITIRGQVVDLAKKQEQEVKELMDTNATDEIKCLPSDNELKTIKAELHSNLSLCQLRLNQPKRAKASAMKATELGPDGTKAWYRLGQACQMANELEKARQAFRKVLEIQPESPAALKALKDLTSREKETNAQLGLRLSKMFN